MPRKRPPARPPLRNPSSLRPAASLLTWSVALQSLLYPRDFQKAYFIVCSYRYSITEQVHARVCRSCTCVYLYMHGCISVYSHTQMYPLHTRQFVSCTWSSMSQVTWVVVLCSCVRTCLRITAPQGETSRPLLCFSDLSLARPGGYRSSQASRLCALLCHLVGRIQALDRPQAPGSCRCVRAVSAAAGPRKPELVWPGSEGNLASPKTWFPGQGDCTGGQWCHHQLTTHPRTAIFPSLAGGDASNGGRPPRRRGLPFRGGGQGPKRLLSWALGRAWALHLWQQAHLGVSDSGLSVCPVPGAGCGPSDGTPAAGLSSSMLRPSVFVQD